MKDLMEQIGDKTQNISQHDAQSTHKSIHHLENSVEQINERADSIPAVSSQKKINEKEKNLKEEDQQRSDNIQ